MLWSDSLPVNVQAIPMCVIYVLYMSERALASQKILGNSLEES